MHPLKDKDVRKVGDDVESSPEASSLNISRSEAPAVKRRKVSTTNFQQDEITYMRERDERAAAMRREELGVESLTAPNRTK